MFYYSHDLDDPVSRVRFGVGDKVAPGYLPDETYEALLAQAGATEETARRAAAAALAAEYAAKPSDVSLPNGLRTAWAERVAQWNRIATGEAGSTEAASPSSTARAPRVGRITAGTDYTVR